MIDWFDSIPDHENCLDGNEKFVINQTQSLASIIWIRILNPFREPL